MYPALDGEYRKASPPLCSSGLPEPEQREYLSLLAGDYSLQDQAILTYRDEANYLSPAISDLREKRPQPRDHGCPLLRPTHGEGQALALREGAAFFFRYPPCEQGKCLHRIAGPVTATLSDL